jgi:hypothetical protein
MIEEDTNQPDVDSVPSDDREAAPHDAYAMYYRRLRRLLVISGILVAAGFSLSQLRTHSTRNSPRAILQVRPPDNPPIVTTQVWFDRPDGEETRYGLRTGMQMIDGMRHESTEIIPCAENGSMDGKAVATIFADPAQKTGHQSDDAAELKISSSIVLRLELDVASPPCVVTNLQSDRLLTLPAVLPAGAYRLRLEWPSIPTASSPAADRASTDPATSRPAISTSQESLR